MRCAKVGRMLSDYHDGCLGGVAAEAARRHLSRCPSCAASLRRLERTADLLRRGRAAPPSDAYWDRFWPRLEARITALPAESESLWRRLIAPPFLRNPSIAFAHGAIAAIVLLVAGNLLLMRAVRRGGALPPGRAPQERVASSAAPGAAGADRYASNQDSPLFCLPGDTVLCDTAGLSGVDEFVLAPVTLAEAEARSFVLHEADYPVGAGMAPGMY